MIIGGGANPGFGVDGAGVKVGVLSDSVDHLAQSQATGDLPTDLTVLPGQSGVPGTGEGSAMLEIVHDLAATKPCRRHDREHSFDNLVTTGVPEVTNLGVFQIVRAPPQSAWSQHRLLPITEAVLVALAPG